MNARHGSGQLAAEFAAKGIEIPRSRPLHRRSWVRRLVFCVVCAAGLLTAAALGFFNRWHDDRLADLARQRQCLETFLRGEEFAAFAHATDAQFVDLLNFVAVKPRSARDALPAVAAYETTHRLLPWSVEVLPLPVSAADQPARIARAFHGVNALLARRDRIVDAPARRGAWQMLARLLAPCVAKFHQRAPDAAFPALALDLEMQEAALHAFAARYGAEATALDVVRMLDLYAALGPAMWRTIERERSLAAGTAPPFTVRLGMP